MIQDYLKPLDDQFDSGFASIAGGFSDAATQLKSSNESGFGIAMTKLPYYYLKRHAIELYLKGCLVLLHRRFVDNFPEGEQTLPMISVGKDKEKTINQIHDLKLIFKAFRDSMTKHSGSIKKLKPMNDWTKIPNELEIWIDKINGADPKGTMLRYPTSKDKGMDKKKSSFKEQSPDQVIKQMSDESSETLFVIATKNEKNEITKTFVHDSDPLLSMDHSMSKCLDMLKGMHLGMLYELVYGFKT